MKILIIEDEPSIADNIALSLEREGFETNCAGTLAAGKLLLESTDFDLLVLDIGLPDGNGFDFCRDLRLTSQIPVIILTARSDEIDRIVGLEIGADDYVCKPFSPRELAARVRAVLRRYQAEPIYDTVQVFADDLEEDSPQPGLFINSEAFEVRWDGQLLKLSAHEFRLLEALASQKGRTFSRQQLLEMAWPEPQAAMERTVDAHIKSLRAKLRKVASKNLIITHRGFGYSLDL